MKKQDLELMKLNVDEIKAFAEKQDYNSYTYINQRLVKIVKVIDDEMNRLTSNGDDMTLPKIAIFTNQDARDNNMKVDEYMNMRLRELVVNGCKIFDFGKLDEQYLDDNTRILYFYIKYNS